MSDVERRLSNFIATLKQLDNPEQISVSPEELAADAMQLASQELCGFCSFSFVPVLENLQGTPRDLQQLHDQVRHSRICYSDKNTICVPLRHADGRQESMIWIRGESQDFFDQTDLFLAQEFAQKIENCFARARIYQGLSEQKMTAENSSRAKTQFLANISHEIRSPLVSILGFSELMVSPESGRYEKSEWGAKIRSSGIHLMRIVDDILDISKVEAGKMDLEIKKIDLRILLQDMQSFALHQAAPKNLKIEFTMAENLPRFVLSDETRLSQVLSNIIGNAIKFTAQGHVRVHATVLEQQPDKIYFEISDSGIGISQEHRSQLFQPFSRVNSHHNKNMGGTGLGLALSHRLAENLGGGVTLKESIPQKGSVFVIEIRAPQVSGAEVSSRGLNETDAELSLFGKNILLVEDSTDTQVLLQRFLESAGAEVRIASDGSEGLKAAQSFKYDVVLMDVQMPGKDGCEVVEELRSLGNQGLIIALTANAMKEERERCLRAGFDAHFSKPIRKNDLIRNIQRLSQDKKIGTDFSAPTLH